MRECDYTLLRKNLRRCMIGVYESWDRIMNEFMWCVEKHYPEQASGLINELSTRLGVIANLTEQQIEGLLNEVYNKRILKSSHIIGQKVNSEYERLVEFVRKYLCDDIPKELEEEWNKKVYRMKGGLIK